MAYLRDGDQWKTIIKPWPPEIDQWTHYLHGPDNNAVAADTVVGPPRHMQWLADPPWTRNHHRLNSISAVVTAGGRLFTISDESSAANVNVPGTWSVAARDAFSGVRLWRKPIPSWAWNQIRFRSGPPQVTRLLVASGEHVYLPLGLSAPVSQLDAATGKTLNTYPQTAGAEELLLVGDVLLVLKGAPVAEQAAGHDAFKQQLVLPNQKSIVAIDVVAKKLLWSWANAAGPIRPETLACDGRQVYAQVGESVACIALNSGSTAWIAPPGEQQLAAQKAGGKQAKKAGVTGMSFGKYTLVVSDGVVLCNLAGRLTAFSADGGKKLWDCKAGAGFHSPADLFVIGGLVWQGSHEDDSATWTPPVEDFNEARDLKTGEVRSRNQVLVDLQTAGHHHRCYREKATTRYIITGKRGIEMMDLAGDNHSRNNWVRGTCQYGILPANGLLYAPPHSCGCYMESKLWGFWALAPAPQGAEFGVRGSEFKGQGSGQSESGSPEKRERLERGPAYTSLAPRPAPRAAEEDWPQYRHDGLRSGAGGTVVPAQLERAWKTRIGGRLTQPVIAEGKVLVASIDENTIYALDETNGNVCWTYTAGGRVDSPPAIHAGRLLFGSADGCVYCLRLIDGQLIWRFRAAPADLRAVAYGQVESLWPVHGSVLVHDGVAYCAAGRSTWLDGGIHLFALDPASGAIVSSFHFQSRHPQFQEGKDHAAPQHESKVSQNTTDYKTFLSPDLSDSFSMAGGAASDVLVSDGRDVFLHQVRFNAKLEKQEEMARHLFSTSSLLDDTENHRSHWVLGTGDFRLLSVAYSWIVDRAEKNGTLAVATGVIMAFDSTSVWAVERKGDANGQYQLVCRKSTPLAAAVETLPDVRETVRWHASRPAVADRSSRTHPRAAEVGRAVDPGSNAHRDGG